MEADIEVANIACPVSIVIDRFQQLKRVIVNVSEAPETCISDERHRSTHHHSKHIPRGCERVPELHQPLSHSFNRGYDTDDVLHSLYPCLEGRSRLFVEFLKPILHFV